MRVAHTHRFELSRQQHARRLASRALARDHLLPESVTSVCFRTVLPPFHAFHYHSSALENPRSIRFFFNLAVGLGTTPFPSTFA